MKEEIRGAGLFFCFGFSIQDVLEKEASAAFCAEASLLCCIMISRLSSGQEKEKR
jgi:hypothetical protein